MNQNLDSEIRGRVRELAEVFGAKAPSDTALAIWIRSLAGIDRDSVLLAFGDWPRFHRTMPTPADIRAEAIKRVSLRLEADAKRNAERSRSETDSDEFVQRHAPENVRLAFESYRQEHRDPHAGDRRWIDRLIAYWARGWYETQDFRVERNEAGLVTRVVTVTTRRSVNAAQEAQVKRAFGGELPPKNHPRVKWCLRSIEELEERDRRAMTFDDILQGLSAMHRQTQARQMPEPPDWI